MSDRRSPAAALIPQLLVVTVLVVAVSIGALPLSGVIGQATPILSDFTLHELSTPNGERSQHSGVNQDGSVVGTTETAVDDSHAILWHDGAMRDLGTLDGSSRGARLDGKLGGYAANESERNRPGVWLPTFTPPMAALARRAETVTPLATPVADTTPISSPSQSGKSVVWDQIDVTVALREDSSFHVTERDRVAFTGGPFRTGYREIPLVRVEDVDNIRVSAVVGDHLQPFRYVAPSDFIATTPNTYTFQEIGPSMRIGWSFPNTTSQSRTFQIEYDATGALRVDDDTESPYQQISWIGVDRELSQTAPVNAASLTFILPRPVDPGETFIQGTGAGSPEDHTADGQTWVWTAIDLGPGESLEARLQFRPLVPAEKPARQDAIDRQEHQDSEAPVSATPVTATPASPGVTRALASPLPTPMATPAAIPPCRDVMRSDFNGKTRDLLADCTTDRPIFVPRAWVFDGGGHTVYAVDPVDDRLTGGVIMVTGESGTVRHVTIDGAGLTAPCLIDDGATALAGVVFDQATGEVSEVTVRNLSRALPTSTDAPPLAAHRSCGAGITVSGATMPVQIEENLIAHVGFTGVLIMGGAASISHNTIDDAVGYGILASAGAHVRVSPGNHISRSPYGIQLESEGTGGRVAGNTIETSSQYGITVAFGAQASIADNIIKGTEVNGIAIEGATTEATIDNNELDDPGEVGIKVYESSAEINDNTVNGGRFGIAVSSGSAQVIGNSVSHPEDTGIYVLQDGATATIEGNTVADAASDGIWVEHGAHATITGNTVTAPRNSGITAVAGATVAISGENVVRGGERGIAIGGAGTTGTVTGNQVEGSTVVGITINTGAAARDVSGNTVAGTRFGIVTLGPGTSATVTDNSVTELEATGYTVESGATAELHRNHVSRANMGIYVDGSGSTADLSENWVEQMTTAGIVLATGSQTIATSNTISMPGTDGIRIAGIGTTATVDGNDVSGATNQGISVLDGARATVSDNAITGGATGVLVKDRGTAIVEGNTIQDATYAGIVFERTPSPSMPNSGGLAIISQDIYFDPKSVTIPANIDVTVVLPNQGAAPHNFSIDELGISVDLAPGATEETVINALAGEYVFYCNVPGHKEAGMVGTLIVSEDTATPAATPLAAIPAATPVATPAAVPPAAAAQPDEAIRRNSITGGQFGVVVKGPGPAIPVEENAVQSVEKTGISIEDEAGADVQRNTVSGATAGINVSGAGTAATITGNRIENTTELGMVVQAGGNSILRKNVVSAAGTSGISVRGDGTTATLEGNIVINAAKNGMVIEHAATATVAKANYVTGGTWGISILGSRTSAEVRGNQVMNASNQGILVLYGATATIGDNQITGGHQGIYLGSPETTATVTGNWLSNPVTNGIYVFEGATGELIEGNTVSGGVRAILITDAGSSAVVSANTVREFSDVGIQLQKGASAEILDNSVDSGKWGIALNTGATATIQDNTVSGASNQGIAIVSGASATIDGNTVEGGDFGIYVLDPESSAVIINNTVAADDQGIGVRDGATGERIEDNTVTGGSKGIVVTGAGSTAMVEANRVRDVSHEGITVREGASATIRRNDVTHVIGGWNILVKDRNTIATVEENTLTDSGGFGIQFSQGAHGAVSGNMLSGVTNTGIRLIDVDTTAIVTGNTVHGSRLGIEGRTPELTITDNIVEDSRQFGILVGPGPNVVVKVTGNTITGPNEPEPDGDGPYGIRVFAGVSGTIAGNQIANHGNPGPEHTACGILIDGEAPNIVVTENLFPVPGNEVNMCDERPRLPSAAPAATPVVATPVNAASPIPAASPGATPVLAATLVVTPNGTNLLNVSVHRSATRTRLLTR